MSDGCCCWGTADPTCPRHGRDLIARVSGFTIPTPFPLESAMVLAAVCGSHAYGTAREGSDVDLRAVVIPPPAYTLGLEKFDAQATPEGSPTDEHVYALRWFVRLAANASVPILEMLFAPDGCSRAHPVLAELLRVRHRFLTKRLHGSLGGYAFNTALRAFQGKAHKGREHLLNAHGYDTKAVYHAVRLWRMGTEVFGGQSFNVRRHDADELLAIRDGVIQHKDVARFDGRELVGGMLYAERLRFDAAFEQTGLLDAPDEAMLSALVADAHRAFYGWGS